MSWLHAKIRPMDALTQMMNAAEEADNRATNNLESVGPEGAEQAAVWAQLATARSIAALAAAVQNIADAINFHAKP
jgi:hypothetical protein